MEFTLSAGEHHCCDDHSLLSLLCVVVVQWLLLTTFKHFIWSYFILTATEEHENKVPQNEGGTGCSLPGVNNKKSDSGT